MSTTIADFLANDHGRLLSLFREFQDTDSSDLEKRRERFHRFCKDMDRHGRWVGSTLFAQIKDRIQPNQREALQKFVGKEPERIEEQINAIREHLEDGNPDTSSLEEQLLSTLQDHFNKEERILYPLFDEHLTDEEVSELLSQFNDELSDV